MRLTFKRIVLQEVSHHSPSPGPDKREKPKELYTAGWSLANKHQHGNHAGREDAKAL